MEVGKKYYVISHAYYHYVGEVTEVNPRGVKMRNVVQVHGCDRGWTEFFKDGFKADTRYDVVPDGTGLSVIDYFPWGHDIPTEKGTRRSR